MVTDARATMATVNDTVKGLKTTLERLDQTLGTVDRNVERTADVQLEGARTLDEMTELLKTLRSLVDTLQQQPEALLQGKPQPKEKK